MDVLEAMELVEAILGSLREQRYKRTDTFKKIFREPKKLTVEMGTHINKPRTTNLQKNRSNFNLQTVEEYYCTAVYVPFMDFIINERSLRFPKSELQRVGHIQKLLSPDCSDGFEDVLQGAEPYKENFPLFFSFERIITSYNKNRGALFSTLRLLKTYLRSTMTEGRLNGLALLHIHQDIASAMKPEVVLDIFARKHKRKLLLNFL
ncbi:hypothetical protein PR048_014482 [Dryococelus australis]|uniref:Uncharacterized protein n=1 Tax=Dryococelus australis TaxID=614101 RepID=A0ABQ9HEJ8_9NEOP|nr:hypothetical protein PR048_014482 [Dryococelus australis]